MNIITGLRRSGTSMLMYALKEAGLDVAGEKYYVKDLEKKVNDKSNLQEMRKLTVSGNPNGYWEVEGVTKDTGLREKIDGDVIKIMSECFFKSDPQLIDKTIIIFREPRKVLNSIFKNNKIEYKEAFIVQNLLDVVDSFEYLRYFNKEVKIVIYENLLKRPVTEMKDICEFLGKGDYKKGAKIIDKKLNRSVKIKKNYENIEIMEAIYEYAKQNKVYDITNFKDFLLMEGESIVQKL